MSLTLKVPDVVIVTPVKPGPVATLVTVPDPPPPPVEAIVILLPDGVIVILEPGTKVRAPVNELRLVTPAPPPLDFGNWTNWLAILKALYISS